jgi:hypothetical protein
VESGQLLIDKRRCWAPLLLCMWYNEQNALFYKYVHGDKETFHFAFRRLEVPYAMPPHPLVDETGAFYQHDFDGKRVFQHRSGAKWDLLGRNQPIPDFIHEATCLQFLRELRERWDGQPAWLAQIQAKAHAAAGAKHGQSLKLIVAMVSCAQRAVLSAQTLQHLTHRGWPADKVLLTLDERRFTDQTENLTHTAWRAFRAALDAEPDYLLYLEDDIVFNDYFFENLSRWGPLARRELHIGGFCNYGLREVAWDVQGCAYLVHPKKIMGSQAVLLSRQMLRYALEHWFEGPPEVDLKLGFLAAQAQQPFFYHCPSLVQHIGQPSTLGNHHRQAADFDLTWKATAEPALQLIASGFGPGPQ